MDLQKQQPTYIDLPSTETASLDQQTSNIHETLINPNDIAAPIAILSCDDGIVVYANDEFKNIIQSAHVGQPIKGLLNSQEQRQATDKKLLQNDKVVGVFEAAENTLHFNVTCSQFVEEKHYIVVLNKIDKQVEFDVRNAQDQTISPTQIIRSTRDIFISQLSELINNEDDESLCLCAIDIDRFRVVNEKYSFEAGDYVLKEVARLIKNNVKSKHVVGRLGGNEFGLIIKNVDIDEAVQICEQVREQVRNEHFSYEGEKIAITVSIGVIAIDKQEDGLEDILAQSALALGTAQEDGRDCVHSSATQDTMMAYHTGKMHYAMIIEDALQNSKFQLFAQPIVDLENPSNHYSYEILLRIYDHIKEDFVSSQELITAAESLEVTTRIDQYVCENVFKLLRTKADNHVRVPNISINLSGHSIVSLAFERFLLELTEKYSVPTSCICFEITESVAVKSISRAQNFIKNLKQVGYRFSLDDFGVGYCSFNYLNLLDVDNVKIDGSFVSAMLDDATQFATVQAITNVARTMNIKTIAEFVEKPEIIKALKVIGVDYGQGYIFGKPAGIDEIFNNITNNGS